MTAEVLVMNRLAVALAADSAVTIGEGKVYTSAEKLFQLSESLPVGVMVYGTADFLGVPWETIVKIHRQRLGQKACATTKGFSDELVQFLKSDRDLFPESAQTTFVREVSASYFIYIRDRLRIRLDERGAAGAELSSEIIEQEFRKLVDEELTSATSTPLPKTLPTDLPRVLLERYQTDIAEQKQRLLGNLPGRKTLDPRLDELTAERLARPSPFKQSGIVVAGFGSNEHFPSYVHLALWGMAAGVPLIAEEAGIGEGQSSVVAFAQHEMVSTFMEGIDPQLATATRELVSQLFSGLAKAILQEVKQANPRRTTKLESRITAGLEKVLKEFSRALVQFQRKNYTDPVVDVVQALPKDELAAMAEALVNLTKFKRRVSREQETVGGPIDVAVISKGDGFIWVKRKHYFAAELNPRVLARYYRGT